MVQHSCPITKLSHPSLNGILPGLRLENHQASIDPRIFPCCQGSGLSFCFQTQQVRQCSLRSRLAQLNQYLLEYAEFWDPKPLPQLNPSVEAKTKGWLHQFKNQRESRGYCLQHDSNSQPSLLWSIGALALWRFHVGVIYVNLGKSNLGGIIQKIRNSENHTICIVEQNEPIWKWAKELESIINWCQNAQIPIWIDFLLQHHQQQTSHNPTSKLSLAQKRLQAIKNAQPLTWVDIHCRSRLTLINQNSNQYQ